MDWKHRVTIEYRRVLIARSAYVDSYEIFYQFCPCVVCEVSLECEQIYGIPWCDDRASYSRRLSATLRSLRSLTFSENRSGPLDPVSFTDIVFSDCAITLSARRSRVEQAKIKLPLAAAPFDRANDLRGAARLFTGPTRGLFHLRSHHVGRIGTPNG